MAQAAKKVEATDLEPTKDGSLPLENNGITVTKSQAHKMADMNTSERIRFLNSQDYSRSQIHKYLNKRYQHVRNVLVTPVKTSQNAQQAKQAK